MQIGYRLLQALSARADVEVHLVITEGARLTFEHETDLEMAQVEGLADVVWDNRDQAAAISSGSFETSGMAVVPCSMKSLSAIVNAYDDDLLVRAADVCAKEGRKVVLVPREAPLTRSIMPFCASACRCSCAALADLKPSAVDISARVGGAPVSAMMVLIRSRICRWRSVSLRVMMAVADKKTVSISSDACIFNQLSGICKPAPKQPRRRHKAKSQR